MTRTEWIFAVALGAALGLAGCPTNGLDGPPGADDDDDAGDPCAQYHDPGYHPDDDDGAGDDDMAGDDDASDDDMGDDDMGDDDVGDDDLSDDDLGDDDGGDDDTADLCDGASTQPYTHYMSADDSNSQAAPALARQWIHAHHAAIGGMRPYEFLNYYTFGYPPAAAGHVDVVPEAHYDDDGELVVLVGVVAPTWEAIGRRPRSITFSVDASGSMAGHPLAMVRSTMCEIARNLQDGDVVSMVTWDHNAAVVLDQEVVDGPFDPDLMAAIDALDDGGSTNLHQGLVTAYDLATAAYSEDRLNRVILMSDGGANTGITDEQLIAEHAEDGEAEGIYLVGVGMDESGFYYDEQLMNTVTDAGRGAYVYIDRPEETAKMFGDDERFMSVMDVAAREVQLSVTLPAGYVIDEFHGEEISPNPHEVDPQHLGPGDAMLYHFVLVDCTPEGHDGSEEFEFTATWVHPVTREPQVDTVTMTADQLQAAAGDEIVKADAVLAYAEALTAVTELPPAERIAYLDEVIALVQDAQQQTGDAELLEIAGLLEEYKLAF